MTYQVKILDAKRSKFIHEFQDTAVINWNRQSQIHTNIRAVYRVHPGSHLFSTFFLNFLFTLFSLRVKMNHRCSRLLVSNTRGHTTRQ